MNKKAVFYCCLVVIQLIVYDTSGLVYLDELQGKSCTLVNGTSVVYKKTSWECSLKIADAGRGMSEAKILCCPLSNDGKTVKPVKNNYIRAAFDACKTYDNGELASQLFGGNRDADNRFPYMAALVYDNTEGGIDDSPIIYKCAGILITSRYVLTAAHCVVNAYGEVPFRVKLGSMDLNSAGESVQTIIVSNVIVHPNYDRSVNYNDIALLRLDRPARKTDNVRPLCLQWKPLANLTIDDNTYFATIGFNKLEVGDKSTEQLMKITNTSLALTNICAAAYTKHPKFPSGMDEKTFCALDSNWNDCNTQISGPLLLVSRNQPVTVIGIPTFRQTCNGLRPDVYVSVYSYLDWIESQVWEGTRCKKVNGPDGIYKKLQECPSRLAKAGVETSGTQIVCCFQSTLNGTGHRANAACHEYQTDGTVDDAGLTQKGISNRGFEFPHIAALSYNNTGGNKDNPVYKCSGALISSRYVLTAAHCVNNVANHVPVRVRLGSMDLKSTGRNVQEISVSNITVHPKYKRSAKFNDVALLRLAKPALFSDTVKPICLPTTPLNLDANNDTSFAIIGFRGMDTSNMASHKLMKTTNISLVPTNICKEIFQGFRALSSSVDDNMICVLDNTWKNRTDKCQIEILGPLLMISKTTKTVIGIPAFGQGCLDTIPDVYMSVYLYLDWIESHVWPEKQQT